MTVTSRRDVDNAVGGFGGGGGGRWDDDVDDREQQRRHDGRSRGDRNFRQHDARRVGDDYDDDYGRRAGRYDKARDDGYHPNARSIPSSTNRHHSTGVGTDNGGIGGIGGGRIIQLRVLYTHQKTKKKKSWKDGRMTLVGTRCSLYDACPIPGGSGGVVLDELELSRREAEGLIDYCGGRRVVDELESDKFLIQVEGPWIARRDYDDDDGGGNAVDDPLWNKRPAPLASSSRGTTTTTNMPSAGHMRVLAIKYRMPSRVLPPHPEERRRRQQRELGMNGGGCAAGSKRSRPLQPGELERMYYGDGGGVGGGGDFERRGPHRGRPHGGDGRGCDDGHRGNVVVGRGRGGGGGGGDRDDFRPRDDGGRRDGREEDDDCDDDGGTSRRFHPAADGDARRRNDEFDDEGTARKDSDGRSRQQQQQRWPTHPPQSQNLHAREVRDDDRRRDAGRHLLPSRTRTDREPSANVAGAEMANYGRWNRSNGRSGDDPGVLGGGKGATFRSNGYDPSGFYDEEEDSDDEGGVAGDCMGDGRVDPSMDEDADQMYGRTSGRGIIGNSGLPVASQERRRDGRNYEIRTSGRQPENHPSDRTERRENSAGVDHRQAPSTAQDDDPHATDELLALLGAEPAPSAGEVATVPRNYPSSATDNEHSISSGRINDTGAAHDNGNPEKGSQFLAGIIQAEERIHNLAADTTKNNTWSFGGDDSISDGFEGWQEVGDEGFDGNDGENNDRELNENIDNDVLHPNNSQDKEDTGATYNLSNFTLPSADESTSSEDEEEEDDDDEQEDF